MPQLLVDITSGENFPAPPPTPSGSSGARSPRTAGFRRSPGAWGGQSRHATFHHLPLPVSAASPLVQPVRAAGQSCIQMPVASSSNSLEIPLEGWVVDVKLHGVVQSTQPCEESPPLWGQTLDLCVPPGDRDIVVHFTVRHTVLTLPHGKYSLNVGELLLVGHQLANGRTTELRLPLQQQGPNGDWEPVGDDSALWVGLRPQGFNQLMQEPVEPRSLRIVVHEVHLTGLLADASNHALWVQLHMPGVFTHATRVSRDGVWHERFAFPMVDLETQLLIAVRDADADGHVVGRHAFRIERLPRGRCVVNDASLMQLHVGTGRWIPTGGTLKVTLSAVGFGRTKADAVESFEREETWRRAHEAAREDQGWRQVTQEELTLRLQILRKEKGEQDAEEVVCFLEAEAVERADVCIPEEEDHREQIYSTDRLIRSLIIKKADLLSEEGKDRATLIKEGFRAWKVFQQAETMGREASGRSALEIQVLRLMQREVHNLEYRHRLHIERLAAQAGSRVSLVAHLEREIVVRKWLRDNQFKMRELLQWKFFSRMEKVERRFILKVQHHARQALERHAFGMKEHSERDEVDRVESMERSLIGVRWVVFFPVDYEPLLYLDAKEARLREELLEEQTKIRKRCAVEAVRHHNFLARLEFCESEELARQVVEDQQERVRFGLSAQHNRVVALLVDLEPSTPSSTGSLNVSWTTSLRRRSTAVFDFPTETTGNFVLPEEYLLLAKASSFCRVDSRLRLS